MDPHQWTTVVLAIPSAVKALKDLLLGEGLDRAAAEQKIATLEKAIAAFCCSDIHLRLKEAKELHDLLSTLDTAYSSTLYGWTKRARPNGIFDPGLLDMSRFRDDWDAVRHHSLAHLLTFLRGASHIDGTLTKDIASKSGEMQQEINRLLHTYEHGGVAERTTAQISLNEAIERYKTHVSGFLSDANSMIRQLAETIGKEFDLLHERITNA